MRLNLRYVRWSIQLGFFSVTLPLLFPVFYCPYRIPWILCDACPLYWCPAKFLRGKIVYLMVGLTVASGRVFCGWACPYGSMQDFFSGLGRMSSGSADVLVRDYRLVKYFFLAITIVLASQMRGWLDVPPLEGILPQVPIWVPLTLGVFLFVSVYSRRFWCRFICPLGAAMSAFNSISPLAVKLDRDKCSNCGECKKECVMVSGEKAVEPKSTDCIVCGECIQKCPKEAVKYGIR